MTNLATSPPFSANVLDQDPADEASRIAGAIRGQVSGTLRRKGIVLGLSGGIDSSVTAALCVLAIGPKKVLGLLMPERDSSPESLRLGRLLGEHLGIELVVEDVARTLEAAGCYRRRDEAIRTLFPEYGPGWKSKIILSDLFSKSPYRWFSLVVRSPDGRHKRQRLSLDAYQGIVAATNFKQRVRKMMEYYHADRLRYAVAGTPNRLELDQGFFVKNGDGAADLKPIAHLYKTQVYRLADYLGLPEAIRSGRPTADTYSLEQSQEEFFFSIPLEHLDLCLHAHEHRIPAKEVAPVVGLSTDQVERVYTDIEAKRVAARYSHQPALVIENGSTP